MKLLEVIDRKVPPLPWEEGEKIPWNDPGFSQRMLALHLSQEHDWASRRTSLVEQHIAWIERTLLRGKSRILDLGCGPGLYAQRFARRGHDCTGLDFSPASIAHAKSQALAENLSIDYRLEDVRKADFGSGFDLVMMVFGEFNVFRPREANAILQKASDALNFGGRILIECHTFEEVKRQGTAPAWWQSLKEGLFADSPHLWLQENFWDGESATATTRFLIVDAISGITTRYASTMQAYTDGEYSALLANAGFSNIERFSSMGETESPFEGKLQVFTAIKQ